MSVFPRAIPSTQTAKTFKTFQTSDVLNLKRSKYMSGVLGSLCEHGRYSFLCMSLIRLTFSSVTYPKTVLNCPDGLPKCLIALYKAT